MVRGEGTVVGRVTEGLEDYADLLGGDHAELTAVVAVELLQ